MIRGRWKARTIGACLLAALGGCQAAQDWRNEIDPIRGGTPIPSNSSATSRPPASGDVPPLQTGRTSTSPAALTVGTGTADADRPAPAAPAVTIQVPRPLVQAAATPPGVVVPVSATAPFAAMPTGGTSFEQIQQALEARGVTEQHLDTTGKPNEWYFTCAVPNANNPLLRRNYETKRVGAGGLEAMRAVLVEIEQDR
jgi:hypothetical protein